MSTETIRETGLPFKAAMARATLDGWKTQTRRIIRIDDTPITEPIPEGGRYQRGIPTDAQNVRFWSGGYLKCDSPVGSVTVSSRVRCPYGKPGDRLWGREGHALVPRTAYAHDPDLPHRVSPDGHQWAIYREGWDRSPPTKWRPSIHMHRWASRILLVITEVRVQRLQEISEADAQAEGAEIGRYYPGATEEPRTYREAFRQLWDSINTARGYGWDTNPYVWAISYRLLDVKGGE